MRLPLAPFVLFFKGEYPMACRVVIAADAGIQSFFLCQYMRYMTECSACS